MTEPGPDVDGDALVDDPAALHAFNASIVEEFRTHGGKVGGMFAGAPMVLVTTVGAKSGAERTTPLVYFRFDDRVLVVGSFGGSPKAPAWLHNLRAHPELRVEIGTEDYRATARELARDDRDALWPRLVEAAPQFADYQAKTRRVIPIIELHRL